PDVLDRAVVVDQLELAAQDVHLGAHLVDPELVVHAQGGELLVHLAHPCGQLLGISPWADELLLLCRPEGVDHAGGVVLGSCRVTACRLVHVTVCTSGRVGHYTMPDLPGGAVRPQWTRGAGIAEMRVIACGRSPGRRPAR